MDWWGLALSLGDIVGVGRVAEVFRWDENEPGPKRVIKLFKSGVLRSAAERELNSARIAFEAGISAPQSFGDVIELDGRFGIVFELVNGPTLLGQIFSDVGNMPKFASKLADLHFQMHRAKPSGLPSKKERLIQSIADAPLLVASEKKALGLLAQALPDGDRLCHGDFHPDNVIFRTEIEGGSVVIDWMDASVGHPMADVARTRLLLEFGWRGARKSKLAARWGATILHQLYARRYFAVSGVGRRDVEEWMTVTAAARLRENVEDEQEHLLKYVRKRLAAGL